jgi:hypothetical protein
VIKVTFGRTPKKLANLKKVSQKKIKIPFPFLHSIQFEITYSVLHVAKIFSGVIYALAKYA